MVAKGEMLSRFDIRRNPNRVVGGRSGFDHAFGGHFASLVPGLGSVPLHLLFDLDLRDPCLAFLGLEGSRLPLVFPLTVAGADIAYRVKPNGAVEILGARKLKPEDDWPYPNYPEYFERVPASVIPLSYEEHRAVVFQHALGPRDSLREDDQRTLAEFSNPFTQLGGVQELPFGDPALYCPNPRCFWHKNLCGMAAVISIWNSPIPGISLWGDDADVVIVYSICTDCRAIYATSMCD
jgi:hypothetical protein